MNKNIAIIILVFLLSLGIIYIVFDNFSDEEEQEKAAKDKLIFQEVIDNLKEKNIQAEEATDEEQEHLERESAFDLPEIESIDIDQDSIDKKSVLEINCGANQVKILDFFSHLDKKDYVKEYQLKNGIYAQYKETITKLSKTPPDPLENKSPKELMQNIYHFYRALSKRDIILIKDVIGNEKKSIEQAMDKFYWLRKQCKKRTIALPSFNTLYEYAHFFLNSVGGKAYLFRLDRKTMVLLLYYSTMIIDESNDKELNKYGVDIIPLLEKMEDELISFSGFLYSDKYLDEISKLKSKYTAPSPATS